MMMETVSFMTTPEIKTVEQPANVDFAIIDLAIDESMLGWVYEQMLQQPIQWGSLYQGTEWRERWRAGPILVELRGVEDSIPELAKEFSKEPKGLFVSATEMPFDEILERFTQQALVDYHGKLAAFRFYEPRHFTEFLTALTTDQRELLVLPGSEWSWHDSESWQLYASSHPASWSDTKVGSIKLSDEQIGHFEKLKRLKRARSLATYYRGWISAEEPEKAVYEHLETARKEGLDRTADQERWLRLALALSSPVEKSAAWRELAGNDQLTPRQKLAKMEETV
ncbi:DUF4123 domain-containing protein [Marinobacter confluentis]|nr:DUF4123 domain-containing protein [Marinobacter confluentis]